jgi:hypothetical protein
LFLSGDEPPPVDFLKKQKATQNNWLELQNSKVQIFQHSFQKLHMIFHNSDISSPQYEQDLLELLLQIRKLCPQVKLQIFTTGNSKIVQLKKLLAQVFIQIRNRKRWSEKPFTHKRTKPVDANIQEDADFTHTDCNCFLCISTINFKNETEIVELYNCRIPDQELNMKDAIRYVNQIEQDVEAKEKIASILCHNIQLACSLKQNFGTFKDTNHQIGSISDVIPPIEENKKFPNTPEFKTYNAFKDYNCYEPKKEDEELVGNMTPYCKIVPTPQYFDPSQVVEMRPFDLELHAENDEIYTKTNPEDPFAKLDISHLKGESLEKMKEVIKKHSTTVISYDDGDFRTINNYRIDLKLRDDRPHRAANYALSPLQQEKIREVFGDLESKGILSNFDNLCP